MVLRLTLSVFWPINSRRSVFRYKQLKFHFTWLAITLDIRFLNWLPWINKAKQYLAKTRLLIPKNKRYVPQNRAL